MLPINSLVLRSGNGITLAIGLPRLSIVIPDESRLSRILRQRALNSLAFRVFCFTLISSLYEMTGHMTSSILLWLLMEAKDLSSAIPSICKGKCYLSAALPYMRTPIFIQESQRDPMVPDGWIPPVYPPHHYSNAGFSTALRHSLVPVGGAFSPRTRTHVLSQFETFVTIKVNGYSLANLLGNWFFDRAGPVKIIKK
jgi:hypothetical protein